MGYIQITLILVAAHFIFHVPMIGSLLLLYAVALLFIAANLAVGITFSTLAQNQLQAVQMAFFFFLPSILLSGFMFPFRGMPEWAQWIGTLPAKHPFHPDRARHSAEGQQPHRDRARTLAAAAVCPRGDDHRREALPADAGLGGTRLYFFSTSCFAMGPSRCMTDVGKANSSPRAATARMMARLSRCRTARCRAKSGSWIT